VLQGVIHYSVCGFGLTHCWVCGHHCSQLLAILCKSSLCSDMSWAVFHAGGWTVDLVAAGTVLLLSLLVIYGAKEGSMFNIGEYQLHSTHRQNCLVLPLLLVIHDAKEGSIFNIGHYSLPRSSLGLLVVGRLPGGRRPPAPPGMFQATRPRGLWRRRTVHCICTA